MSLPILCVETTDEKKKKGTKERFFMKISAKFSKNKDYCRM